MVIDGKKVHLSGVAKPAGGNHSVQAPEERKSPGTCWALNKWLYGMRPAAMSWEEEDAMKLESMGMASTTAEDVASVHGDDFVVTGPKVRADNIKGKVKPGDFGERPTTTRRSS